jgi:hypothetical protein
MRRIYSTFIAAALSFLAAASAFAEDVVVPANRSTLLGVFRVGNSTTCQYGAKPKMRIVTAPEHGRIDFAWRMAPVTDKGWGLCKGRSRYGMFVVYTPKAGFHGKDFVKIGITYQYYVSGQDTSYMSWQATLIVK